MHKLTLANENGRTTQEREPTMTLLEVMQLAMSGLFPTESGLEGLLDQIEGAA